MGLWGQFRAWLRQFRRAPTLGQRGEQAAARYLERLGYIIVARSDRSRFGELDIVAVDGQTIVFVEVKTRSGCSFDEHPADAVDEDKQRRIARLALLFMKRHELLEYGVRFDIVAVLWPADRQAPHIEHFPHAFEAPGPADWFA